VSFDVFFQGFVDGEPSAGGGERMREVLAPHIVREEPEYNLVSIEFGDGSANVYLDENEMMANHIAGDRPWDLLVEGARAAGWVILPVGCPTCITDEAHRAGLPEGLHEDVAFVRTGSDLLRVITAS